MGTHSICLYKEVAKQYTSCNPKSTELLDCALIGVCAVIRSNTVFRVKVFKIIPTFTCMVWPRVFVVYHIYDVYLLYCGGKQRMPWPDIIDVTLTGSAWELYFEEVF